MPLLVYFVGVPNPHVAIGSSAAAVAVNALMSLANHARAKTIKWRCASVFALFGIAGAFAGSTLGKFIDGEKLLALFAILMIVVAYLMLRRRGLSGYPAVRLNRENFPRLVGAGLTAGALSGFFGIGGGFLIVPGLVYSTGMPLLNAVGSSLMSVTSFGLTTAGNYALSGLVDWRVAGFLLLGGFIGGLAGVRVSRHLAAKRPALSYAFAGIVVAVGAYVVWRGLGAFF